MADDELILTERRGNKDGILWLTLNRPDKLNAPPWQPAPHGRGAEDGGPRDPHPAESPLAGLVGG